MLDDPDAVRRCEGVMARVKMSVGWASGMVRVWRYCLDMLAVFIGVDAWMRGWKVDEVRSKFEVTLAGRFTCVRAKTTLTRAGRFCWWEGRRRDISCFVHSTKLKYAFSISIKCPFLIGIHPSSFCAFPLNI